MGLRETILKTLKDAIDGLQISDGSIIRAVNTYFDPFEEESQLPKFSVVPGPETIRLVTITGSAQEHLFRVELFGYSRPVSPDDLFLNAEEVIEKIIDTLIAKNNTADFPNFSIVEIGPVIAEQFETKDSMSYLSIPLSVEFIQPGAC